MPAEIKKSDLAAIDLAAIFASLEKINHRLDKLEDGIAAKLIPADMIHPSLDKVGVAEAIADAIFAGAGNEKACQFEPDKPCDHCSMCNSRGF